MFPCCRSPLGRFRLRRRAGRASPLPGPCTPTSVRLTTCTTCPRASSFRPRDNPARQQSACHVPSPRLAGRRWPKQSVNQTEPFFLSTSPQSVGAAGRLPSTRPCDVSQRRAGRPHVNSRNGDLKRDLVASVTTCTNRGMTSLQADEETRLPGHQSSLLSFTVGKRPKQKMKETKALWTPH